MKLKGQLEWTDYLNSQLLHIRASSGILIMIGIGFVGGLYLTLSGAFPIGLMIPGFFLVGLLLLYRYIFLPNRVEKIFFQQKDLALPFEMEINDTGLFVVNELGEGTRPWKNFTKWKENKDLLILYHSDVLYSIIPKRLFFDVQQVEIVKAYLKKDNILEVRDGGIAGFIKGCGIYIILLIVIAIMLYVNFRQQ